MIKDKYFRANVGAIIINSKNDVLAFERSDHKGSWQLPQGGIQQDEEILDSIKREVKEETGILENELKLIGVYPDWMVYELPKEMRNEKIGRGQIQKWFLFRIIKKKLNIDLNNFKEREFCNWKWMSMAELVDIVVEFRKPTYKKLKTWLSKMISKKKA